MTAAQSKFHELLRTQIRNEFTASQQYTAVAVHWSTTRISRSSPRTSTQQALEERNHAMGMVQYLLDNDLPITIPGIDAVRNDFSSLEEIVELALRRSRRSPKQIATLARTARDEGDYLGEQFMQWYLKEQVEEVASMTTLLRIVRSAPATTSSTSRTSSPARSSRDLGTDPTAPPAAGGNAIVSAG